MRCNYCENEIKEHEEIILCGECAGLVETKARVNLKISISTLTVYNVPKDIISDMLNKLKIL